MGSGDRDWGESTTSSPLDLSVHQVQTLKDLD